LLKQVLVSGLLYNQTPRFVEKISCRKAQNLHEGFESAGGQNRN
jgi:hypothetical protein